MMAAFDLFPDIPVREGPPLSRASDLLRRQLPKTRWAIPGLLPEGVTLLAGAPKIGKSWLALDLPLP